MKKNIFQGPTFQGKLSFIGLLLIVAGIFLIINRQIIFGALAILFGFFLFFNLKGTLIDMEKGVVKPYFLFLFFKIGKQYNLKEFSQIAIGTSKDALRMNSRGSSGEYRTKTFNVVLLNNDKRILLKQFMKKNQADVFKKEMQEVLNF